MGYELVFYFHEEVSKGEYNKEEVKKKSVKVGSPYDEVALEVVAGKIIAQLARRNILVVDVDIFEFTRKKLSYKETSDGILIKNKKFSFDDGAVVISSECKKEEITYEDEIEQKPSSNGHEKSSIPPSSVPPTTVIRYEIYDPAYNDLAHYAKEKGYKLTVNKSYPVLSETLAGRTYNYTVIDDEGNAITVSGLMFYPKLNIQDDSTGVRGSDSDIDLSYGETLDEEMVNLR